MSKLYTVTACRWFDTYGNTYHSVRCVRHSDEATIGSGRILKYGYNDHYKVTAQKLMQEAGWIVFPENTPPERYDRNNGYPILWLVSDGLKRDAVENGDVD